MNLKLLIKLVKLANNNPNENEANLAARKACKMIELGEFKFVEDSPLPGNFKPHPKQEESYRGPIRYTGFSTPPSPGFDWLKDFMNRARNDPIYKDMHQGSWDTGPSNPFSKPFKNKTPPKREYHRDDEKYYSRRAERGFGDTKRILSCSKCHQKKETIFVGLEEVFICNQCSWNAYTEVESNK